MESLPVFDIKNTCRICLVTPTDQVSLWDCEKCDGTAISKELAEMLTECTSIKVEKDGILSEIICSECLPMLTTMYAFRQRCIETNTYLNKLAIELNISLNENSTVKSYSLEDAKLNIKGDFNLKTASNFETEPELAFWDTTNSPKHEEEEIEIKDVNENGGTKRGRKRPLVECRNCKKIFRTESVLEQHSFYCASKDIVKTSPNDAMINTPLFPCDICHIELDTKRQLVEHFYGHVAVSNYFDFKQDDNLFFCYACDEKQFKDEMDLRKHFKTHLKYTCKICQKTYKRLALRQLLKHLKNHGVWTNICQICLISFQTEEEAIIHVKNHRQIDSKSIYECALCVKNFKSCSQLKEHVKIHFKAVHYCTECIMPFNDLLELEIHKEVHDSPRICTVCGLKFDTDWKLKLHFTSHIAHHACDSCPKAFRTTKLLRLHKRTHHLKPYSFAVDDCSEPALADAMNTQKQQNLEGRKRKCHNCNKIFGSQVFLKQHYFFCARKVIENTSSIDSTIDDPRFPCDICHIELDTMPKLVEHFYGHISVATYFNYKQGHLFYCIACDQTELNDEFDLSQHLKTRHLNDYKCKICQKSYKYRGIGALRKHLKLHGVRPHICQICLISFPTEEEVEIHVLGHYQNDTKSIYECVLCVEKFTSCSELKEHIIIHNKGFYFCSECDLTFNDLPELESHKQIDHPKPESSRVCPECGVQFPRDDCLKYHILRYHTTEIVSCDICEKTFPNKITLAYHKRKHDTRIFRCPYPDCSYVSNLNGSIKKHLRCIHSNERPYKCTYNGCTMAFKQGGALKDHLTRHYGIKNYACSICERKFVTNVSRKEHEQTHNETLAYSCDICGRTFRMASYMRAHKRKIHKSGVILKT